MFAVHSPLSSNSLDTRSIPIAFKPPNITMHKTPVQTIIANAPTSCHASI